MKKGRYNSQKGAISVFVMITMVFFLASIIGIYMISSKRAQMQTESVKLMQDRYYTTNEENEIYQNKMASATQTIPIYTKEQLWSVASGKVMQIEGKVYTFSSNARYELKNDIVINIDEMEDQTIIDDTAITKHDFEIYYYYNGDYYIPASDDTVDLSMNGNDFRYKNLSKELGYVTDGLMLHYDAIKNTSTGHSNTSTKWKDLSGHGNDGNLTGPTWLENALSFDGVNDAVTIGELNYETPTVEAVIQFDQIGTAEQIIMANFEAGGYGLHYWSRKNSFQIYTNNYHRATGEVAVINKKYFLSGRYDGNNIYLRENDQVYQTAQQGAIKLPNSNTIMVLGANPGGTTVQGGYFSGKIYAVRIYDRSLSEEEVRQNYEIDKLRFNIQ